MQTVNTKQLAQKLKEEKINLIDVREPFEFIEGHVKGAINKPMSQLRHWKDELEQDQTYYMMCRSGNRSGQVANLLTELGHKIYNVEGGILAWDNELEQ